MIIEMTRQLAYAAATDAGNRNMRLNGRDSWNEEDCEVATACFYRLWPEEKAE